MIYGCLVLLNLKILVFEIRGFLFNNGLRLGLMFMCCCWFFDFSMGYFLWLRIGIMKIGMCYLVGVGNIGNNDNFGVLKCLELVEFWYCYCCYCCYWGVFFFEFLVIRCVLFG